MEVNLRVMDKCSVIPLYVKKTTVVVKNITELNKTMGAMEIEAKKSFNDSVQVYIDSEIKNMRKI